MDQLLLGKWGNLSIISRSLKLGPIPHPKRRQRIHRDSPNPRASKIGDGPGTATPDQFDSTGPRSRAIRLTRLAESPARLRSEYFARGAERVSSM